MSMIERLRAKSANWKDAAKGYKEAGIVYAYNLLMDAAAEVDAILAESQAGEAVAWQVTEDESRAIRTIKVGDVLTQAQWDAVCSFVREQEVIIDQMRAEIEGAPPAPSAADEGAAYEAWFRGEQGKEYDGMWQFARAAWMHRAALPTPTEDKGGAWPDDAMTAIERAQTSAMVDNDKSPSSYKEGIIKGMDEALRIFRRRAALAAAAPPALTQPVDDLDRVVKFLLGEGELSGAWYGDEPPASLGPTGKFWWRKQLRCAWQKLQPAPSSGEGAK